jgi:hypothetical protein
MKTIKWIATLLIVVGAINWGLVGIWDFNLVDAIFGSWQWLETTVYVLVGLSGLWGIGLLFSKRQDM